VELLEISVPSPPFFYATEDIEEVSIPFIDIELPHIILLVMLTLFGVGVIKMNKGYCQTHVLPRVVKSYWKNLDATNITVIS
jgi:hypothetical protein